MKKQSLKKPFFSTFLENQLDKNTQPEVQGGDGIGIITKPAKDLVQTQKYPSDSDEYVTHKYPSDSEDAVTQKFPSDGDDDLVPFDPSQP